MGVSIKAGRGASFLSRTTARKHAALANTSLVYKLKMDVTTKGECTETGYPIMIDLVVKAR
jgi:hypothetical protein